MKLKDKMKFDMINKFSLAQATSNSADGKSSGSGFLGLITGLAGVLSFLFGVIDYSFISKTGTIMTQAIIVITLGAGLLGLRKSIDGKNGSIISSADEVEETEIEKTNQTGPIEEQLPKTN